MEQETGEVMYTGCLPSLVVKATWLKSSNMALKNIIAGSCSCLLWVFGSQVNPKTGL